MDFREVHPEGCLQGGARREGTERASREEATAVSHGFPLEVMCASEGP